MDVTNSKSLTSSTTANHSDNNIIDLTVPLESPTVKRGTVNIIIELNDSVLVSPPQRRRLRRSNQTNRNCTESQENSDIVVIEDSPVAPSTRPRKVAARKTDLSRSNNNDKSQERQQTDRSSIDRRGWFFGDCPICFEPLGRNQLASTKCGHVFCLKCLSQSVRFSKKCPSCRTGLNGITGYHPLYFSKSSSK